MIDIPRDISFRGDFTLVDRSGGSSTTLKNDLTKLTDISDSTSHQIKHSLSILIKILMVLMNRQIQVRFKFDVVKNEDEGAVDLVFARAR